MGFLWGSGRPKWLSQQAFRGLVDAHVPRERRDPARLHARRVEVLSGFSLFRGNVVRPPRA